LEKKFNSLQAQLKGTMEEKKILLERIDTLEMAHGVQLKGYQDGEQKQAAVMQKLHSKILEYKGKCHEMESQLSVQKATYEHTQEQVSYGFNLLCYFCACFIAKSYSAAVTPTH